MDMDDSAFASAFGDLARLYARLAEELAAVTAESASTPDDPHRCRACGRCCHFEAVEHTLFASALEAAYCFSRAAPPPTGPRGDADAANGAAALERCPYQLDERCAAHAARPLGCRLYFCGGGEPGASITGDAAEDDAAAERAERYHQALKRLHEEHHLPWDYRPWLLWTRRNAESAGAFNWSFAKRLFNLEKPFCKMEKSL